METLKFNFCLLVWNTSAYRLPGIFQRCFSPLQSPLVNASGRWPAWWLPGTWEQPPLLWGHAGAHSHPKAGPALARQHENESCSWASKGLSIVQFPLSIDPAFERRTNVFKNQSQWCIFPVSLSPVFILKLALCLLSCRFSAPPRCSQQGMGRSCPASAMVELCFLSGWEHHVLRQSLLVSCCLRAQAAKDYIATAYISQNTEIQVGRSLF